MDFDGVIHSYRSGWKGVEVIPDAPVEGAFEWLAGMLEAETGPLPVIYSARSREEAGVRAMVSWFVREGFPPRLLDRLAFPTQKPGAFLTVDDRAICFEGHFPSVEEMMAFRPWYRRW